MRYSKQAKPLSPCFYQRSKTRLSRDDKLSASISLRSSCSTTAKALWLRLTNGRPSDCYSTDWSGSFGLSLEPSTQIKTKKLGSSRASNKKGLFQSLFLLTKRFLQQVFPLIADTVELCTCRLLVLLKLNHDSLASCRHCKICLNLIQKIL